MSKELKVSIIIPTVDRADAVYNLLKQLEEQTYSHFDILVIEQSKQVDERIKKYAEANSQKVKLIHIERRNLPNARNVGIKNASGEIILFLDDDIIPDNDLIKWHIENYKENWVNGVGGRVIGGYDKIPKSARVGDFRKLDGKVIRNFNSEIRKEVKHLPGGNMSFKKIVFEHIGFFDEKFGGAVSEGEETDFCLRVQRAGFRFIFEPKALVKHLHIKTGGCREYKFDDWIYWHGHNSMLFAMRHMKRISLFIFMTQRLLRFLMFTFGKISLAPFISGLKGLINGIKTYRLNIKTASL